MTLRQFFTGRAIVFTIILIGLLCVFAYKTYVSPAPSEAPTVSPQETVVPKGTPTFAWHYEKSDALNLDGFARTKVFVKATYPDGTVLDKLVDTTDGTCGTMPEADKDSVSGTTTIQCYAAGLGYWFKITKGPTSYLVQRKMFEEGVPEEAPPEYPYEVIAEFSY